MRIGGTEQVIRNLIEASDPAKVTMSIFCVEAPLGPWGKELQDAGTQINCVARKPGFDFGLVRTLRRYLHEHSIDVLHCHQYTPWTYGALAAAGLATRVIFTEHGRFYPDTRSAKRRYINPVLAWLTDHITAISDATRQALENYEYLPAKRIGVIYNGISPVNVDADEPREIRKQLGLSDDTTVLGSIARFDTIKNHPMLLSAFAQVVSKNPNCFLLLVGDGDERANIERKIDELGIGDKVILPGYKTNPAGWLAAMDVFLLSSFSEGTSMTLLEAMSLGKPCVVTDVGGNPEIICDGENGLVTPNDDAQRFGAAITRLMGNRELVSSMRQAALQRFEKLFTSSAMARSYATLYESPR